MRQTMAILGNMLGLYRKSYIYTKYVQLSLDRPGGAAVDSAETATRAIRQERLTFSNYASRSTINYAVRRGVICH